MNLSGNSLCKDYSIMCMEIVELGKLSIIDDSTPGVKNIAKGINPNASFYRLCTFTSGKGPVFPKVIFSLWVEPAGLSQSPLS